MHQTTRQIARETGITRQCDELIIHYSSGPSLKIFEEATLAGTRSLRQTVHVF